MDKHIWHVPFTIEGTIEVSHMEPIDQNTAESNAMDRLTRLAHSEFARSRELTITVGTDQEDLT